MFYTLRCPLSLSPSHLHLMQISSCFKVSLNTFFSIRSFFPRLPKLLRIHSRILRTVSEREKSDGSNLTNVPVSASASLSLPSPSHSLSSLSLSACATHFSSQTPRVTQKETKCVFQSAATLDSGAANSQYLSSAFIWPTLKAVKSQICPPSLPVSLFALFPESCARWDLLCLFCGFVLRLAGLKRWRKRAQGEIIACRTRKYKYRKAHLLRKSIVLDPNYRESYQLWSIMGVLFSGLKYTRQSDQLWEISGKCDTFRISSVFWIQLQILRVEWANWGMGDNLQCFAKY